MINILYPIFIIIAIAINLYFLHYLINLNTINCTCSVNNYRKFIIYATSIYIALQSIVIILLIGNANIYFTLMFLVIATLLMFINVIIIILYINKLKKEKCECSKNIARTLMYISSIISLISMSIGIFIALYLSIKINSIQQPKITNTKIQNTKITNTTLQQPPKIANTTLQQQPKITNTTLQQPKP
jgi:hypothetical protein